MTPEEIADFSAEVYRKTAAQRYKPSGEPMRLCFSHADAFEITKMALAAKLGTFDFSEFLPPSTD